MKELGDAMSEIHNNKSIPNYKAYSDFMLDIIPTKEIKEMIRELYAPESIINSNSAPVRRSIVLNIGYERNGYCILGHNHNIISKAVDDFSFKLFTKYNFNSQPSALCSRLYFNLQSLTFCMTQVRMDDIKIYMDVSCFEPQLGNAYADVTGWTVDIDDVIRSGKFCLGGDIVLGDWEKDMREDSDPSYIKSKHIESIEFKSIKFIFHDAGIKKTLITID